MYRSIALDNIILIFLNMTAMVCLGQAEGREGCMDNSQGERVKTGHLMSRTHYRS